MSARIGGIAAPQIVRLVRWGLVLSESVELVVPLSSYLPKRKRKLFQTELIITQLTFIMGLS